MMYGLLALCAVFVVIFAREREWGTTLFFVAIFISLGSLYHIGSSDVGAEAPATIILVPETG